MTDAAPSDADPYDAALSVADADARIDALGPRRSLCPGRTQATSLAALAGAAPASLRGAFERCLARIAVAQVAAFPENIFWDFDALAHSLLGQATEATESAEVVLERMGGEVAALQGLFGAGTTIRFRYVHDFSYGFDWSKWVQRDPVARAANAPFSAVFIQYSLRRGHELLDLIAADDTKYPKLPDGKPRNPFGFSRSRSDEIRLFEHLAEEDLLPLRAWESHPKGRWDHDYRARRDAEAKKMGL